MLHGLRTIKVPYPMQSGLDLDDIKKRVGLLRSNYKDALQFDGDWSADAFRVRRAYRNGGAVIDLGGGVSAHNGVLAQLGMTVYVIDMLSEYWEHKATAPVNICHEVQALEACGVRFIQQDISTCDLTKTFDENSIDIVTSFHCIEHLHHSPRLVLDSAMRVLKPGGTMLIEVPNAANARKRLAILCGHTNYGSYNSFYYNVPFVGHVREYTVGDLRHLAQNLGASSCQLFGKNDTVYGSWVRTIPLRIRKLLDRGLQMLPGLCSSLVLELTK
jgi:2-polyprenyl-3-methyl-5-hydroxy-6-metoxy-1,4-benzoquinol methylase